MFKPSLSSIVIFLFMSVFFCSNGSVALSGVYNPIDSSYKLTFDDEFNGGAIDTTKWSVGWFANQSGIDRPVNPNEIAAYDIHDVTVSGGLLTLNATKSPLRIKGKLYPYRTGLINTIGKFSQTFGYFESRICLAAASGQIANWPSWWLVGGNWPNGGELDIMEGLGGQVAYHFHSPAGGPGASVVGDFAGCHVYGALWKPGIVTYYYDGSSVGVITTGITDKPQSMILGFSVGGFGGPVVVPSIMQIDYVRAWSNDPAAQAVAPQAGYDGPGVSGNQIPVQPQPLVVAQAYATNLINNPGFESGAVGWSTSGQAIIANGAARSDQMAALLNGKAGFQQTIQLKPHTSYLLSGYVRSLDGTCTVIGVKNYGGKQVANCSSSTAWTQIQIPFATSMAHSQATIFFWQSGGSSMADDFSVIAR